MTTTDKLSMFYNKLNMIKSHEYISLVELISFDILALIDDFPKINSELKKNILYLLKSRYGDLYVHDNGDDLTLFNELEKYLTELFNDKLSFINSDLHTELDRLPKYRMNDFERIELINNNESNNDSFCYFNDIQLLINKFS